MTGRTKSFAGIVNQLPQNTRMATHAEQWRPVGGANGAELPANALFDDITPAPLTDDITNAQLTDDL